MKLCINKLSTVEHLKESFSLLYPFLSVALYAQDVLHNNNGQKKPLTGTVAHLLPSAADFYFVDISGEKTVAEVEAAFALAGLQAQVLRKSGTMWIETLLTRNWTLEMQNHEGETLSYELLSPYN